MERNFIILDHIHPCVKEIMGKYGGVDVVLLPSAEELKKIISKYDAVIMRADPHMSPDVLDAAPKLKIISICGVGTNHIDKPYAAQKGIQIVNAPGLNYNAVAELTISKMLDLSRDIIPAHRDIVVDHIWDKYKYMGSDLRYKTIGIMGFGKIGRRVGELAKAFDMEVLAYDPFVKPEDGAAVGVKITSLDELLRVSDFVTMHIPLGPDSYHIISYDQIKIMKKNCVVINMSRGGVLDEKAAFEALKENRLGGVGLDVMEQETAGAGLTGGSGIKFDSPLFNMERFAVTPHLGGSTWEATRAVGEFVCSRIIEILELKPINE